MFWLLRTVAPESRAPEQTIQALDDELFGVIELGLDGLVADGPAGMRLALQVRMQILKPEYMSQTLNGIINTRRVRAAQGRNLDEQIHFVIWHYMCGRMAPTLPPCNHHLNTDPLTEVSGLTVGRLLDEGVFGDVYALHHPSEPDDVREVVKVIAKGRQGTVQAIKRLRTMAEVLRLVSSAEWQRPNLVQLRETYYSRTHLMFRMEYGGSTTLFTA